MTGRRLTGGLAAAALLVAGCGGGDRITETRSVARFDRIVVTDGIDVDVVQGAPGEIRVRAGEDVIDRVHTRSRGEVLEIGLGDRGIVIGPDPLGDARVEVPTDDVSSIEIAGAGAVDASGLDAEELSLEVRGAGDIEASGTVDRLRAEIHGAGDADLSALFARRAIVVVEGAGDADLNVSERLDVTVRGAADVSYIGDPDVSSEIHGAADVSRVRP